MTAADLRLLLPLVVIGYGSMVVLVVGAFWRRHAAMSVLALAVLAAAFASVVAAAPSSPREVGLLLRFDGLSSFYLALVIGAAFAIVLLSHDYLAASPAGSEKYYSLLLLAVLGMAVLVVSAHFVAFLLGLELLSVSLYGLIGYAVRRQDSLEAAIKYLVLGGTAIGFLLVGMAVIYYQFGTMRFAGMSSALEHGAPHPLTPALFGLGLILVGFGFKIAVVPFHAWAPDVYQGAPAPAAALLATGSKAAAFVLLLRFLGHFPSASRPLFLALSTLAVMTMFGGNLLALTQENLKRLLGYSAVSHIGYLLIPLLAGGPRAAWAIAFYFAAYFLAVIAAFAVISALSSADAEPQQLRDYAGLGHTRPWLGAALALSVLSLAGLPPTAGFMAKLYLFATAARPGTWFLLVVGVVNAALAAYYYLRVVAALYLSPPATAAAASLKGALRWPTRVVLAAVSLLIIAIGVYPSPLIALVQAAAGSGGR
jgi:NADH-quinone oxidoreductase subunit N